MFTHVGFLPITTFQLVRVALLDHVITLLIALERSHLIIFYVYIKRPFLEVQRLHGGDGPLKAGSFHHFVVGLLITGPDTSQLIVELEARLDERELGRSVVALLLIDD
mmetsp:Transcript_17458/g.16669  ORF Transcript_17458/g.16669 Transcript_17458/m.16669 type:complete len:108 (-) Transcript_17458:621-944(-)